MTSLPIDVKSIKRYVKNKNEYYNYAVAFDIETTSFRLLPTKDNKKGEPRACMYIWQMCFGDSELLVYGRTWEEFEDFIRLVRKHFHLKKDRILPVYAHNLSFEMQWLRKRFKWSKVFALDKRVPLYARTNFGLEFRCSYRLSGYSLETLAKNLTSHDIEKLVGDLDYSLPRHSGTPLTPKEMDYCMYDVRIVCAYISERLEIDGNVNKIPLTKTGYVRRDCQVACYGKDHDDKKYRNYRKEMTRLTMETDEYRLLRCAFMGGFTHANPWYVGEILENVTSFDFTSSYPYCMFAYKYPWSKGELCHPDVEEVIKTMNVYGYILDLELYGVESKILQDDYLSKSRCVECKGYVLNNGRVNSAEYIHVVLTSVDFEILLQTYRFNGGIKIRQAYKYYMKYLPTDFINELLDYYEGKTTLKNVVGKEEEYLSAKERVNACYGMVCTSPVRPTITYDNDEWDEIPVDLEKGVGKYNRNPNRFLPYIVGVFVTAYARRNLWSGILAVGSDYVYADTDSIKLLNYENHKEYFEEYNKNAIDLLKRACEYHGIDFSRVSPKTIKGVEKILGVWDCESTTPDTPTYKRFKTLGAKRYMIEDYTTGEISLTVSGLNKKKAIPYLLEEYGRDKIFDVFTDDEYHVDYMKIPEGYSGRMDSIYIDYETEGELTDYLGNVGHYHELSSVSLENSTYSLSLAKDYYKFLLGIKNRIV